MYAIEFTDQDDNAKNFWGITFPSVETKGSPQISEQSGIARRRRNVSSLQG
jgi:hypothetical protein